MALVEMDFALGSGGGGGIKSGIFQTTTEGETVVIHTGLSNIRKFNCVAYNPTYTNTILYHSIVYDPTAAIIGAGNFYTLTTNGSSNFDTGVMSIGAAQTVRGWVISSISGGDITIKTQSAGGGWQSCEGFWTAE